jgi:peptide methionine sulfoxide reductase MsrA
VGYSGGLEDNPTYSAMKDHTESVLIEYDTKIVQYETIIQKWKVLCTPYPTKRQYRTAIFYLSDQQERLARSVTTGMDDVDVERATRFYAAEQYHQNFLSRK